MVTTTADACVRGLLPNRPHKKRAALSNGLRRDSARFTSTMCSTPCASRNVTLLVRPPLFDDIAFSSPVRVCSRASIVVDRLAVYPLLYLQVQLRDIFAEQQAPADVPKTSHSPGWAAVVRQCIVSQKENTSGTNRATLNFSRGEVRLCVNSNKRWEIQSQDIRWVLDPASRGWRSRTFHITGLLSGSLCGSALSGSTAIFL